MSTPPPEDEPRREGPWDALLRAMLGPDADNVLKDLSARGELPDLSAGKRGNHFLGRIGLPPKGTIFPSPSANLVCSRWVNS